MKSMLIVGIVLIVVGTLGLGVKGINYTTEEEVVEIGSLQVTSETEKTIDIPVVLSGLTLIAGIVFVLISSRKKNSIDA